MQLMVLDLQKLLNSLPFPVIACKKTGRQVLCLNSEARLLTDAVPGPTRRLEDILRCRYESDIRLFWKNLDAKGSLQNFALDALDRKGEPLNILLSAEVLPGAEGEDALVIVSLSTAGASAAYATHGDGGAHRNALLFKMLSTTYHSLDLNQTVNEILEMLGTHLNVSRAYIFEELSTQSFANTYKWCAPGLNPREELNCDYPKSAFAWDVVRDKLYIASDVKTLPEKDRLILAPREVKSIVILPLFIGDAPVGFLGCDECAQPRIWTHEELQLLESSSALLSTLLSRKRAQWEAQRYQEIMKTVLDNTPAAIYVSDFATDEILFANKYLKETLGEEGASLPRLEGKTCWKVLHRGMDGPCLDCPKGRLLDANGQPNGLHTWEHHDTARDRWYLITDAAIRWIDGRYVHMKNARDISDQKQKEEELKRKADELKIAASTDALTGIYNRQMGAVLMQEGYKRVRRTGKKSTLCFLDLDGLKKVNDTYGHSEGDRMILSFSTIIKEVIRGIDIFCRWGGDEFVLLLDGCDAVRAETVTLQRIREKITAFNALDGILGEKTRNYTLDFSYGFEEFDAGSPLTLDQLIASADRKMYDNKMGKRTALL